MEDVYNFLQDIGCSDIIEVFKEQEIDLETVFLLKENELKELFPKIGPRLKFRKYIEKQKSTNNIPIVLIDEYTVQSESGSTGSITESTVSANDERKNNDDIKSLSEESTVSEIENKSEHASKKDTTLLENNAASLDGRAILREGQIGGGLLKECSRRKLSQLLIHNQLEQDPAKNISSQEFYDLASDICQLFEKESVLVYFSAYVAPTTLGTAKKNASGKLYETYISRRRKLRENGSLSSRRSRSSSKSTVTSTASNSSTFVTEDAAENEDLQEENLLWLHNNVDPWQTVEEKWKATTCTRLKNISKGDGLIEDYYKNFPALKQPQGYTLLLEDFYHLHPGKDNGLFSNLALKKEIIIKHASKKVSNLRDKLVKKALTDLLGLINDADPETCTNVALMLLAYVINLSPARKKKNKPLIKPSRAEVCDSYISQASNEGAVTSYMIKKKEKHLESGQTLQPYVIFVGDSVVEIRKAYVIVNDTFYAFQKLITAVDCAFKIFQALNAHYPAESEDVLYSIFLKTSRLMYYMIILKVVVGM